ncbi:endochitinase-like [Ornithodoros turicata]|uniref:endochitinase-like n=1 Tax=Ornithodoros turicata TaxID=34597 RepID=UPI003138DC0F
MPLSEMSLLSRKSLAHVNTDDPFIRSSCVYTMSSCMILVVVFFVVLPGALIPYFKKVRYLAEVPRIEDQARSTPSDGFGPLTLCQVEIRSFSRPSPWSYSPEYIPVDLCSHAVFNVEGLRDWFNDMLNYDMYQSAIRPLFFSFMQDLRKRQPSIQVYVAVGTFTNLTTAMGSVASSSRDTVPHFARNVLRWTLGNRIDGVLFGGMFPTAPDRRNAMVKLLKKTGTLFRVQRTKLGIIVPSTADVFGLRGSGKKLSSFVDLVIVPAYREAPPTKHRGILSMQQSIEILLNSGIPSRKIIVGVVFHGSLHQVSKKPFVPQMNATFKELPYYEVCQWVRDGGWDHMLDMDTLSAYAHKSNVWVNFDDRHSLALKADLIRNSSLGGMMAWDISLDDYRGVCGLPYPLLTAMHDQLLLGSMSNVSIV